MSADHVKSAIVGQLNKFQLFHRSNDRKGNSGRVIAPLFRGRSN